MLLLSVESFCGKSISSHLIVSIIFRIGNSNASFFIKSNEQTFLSILRLQYIKLSWVDDQQVISHSLSCWILHLFFTVDFLDTFQVLGIYVLLTNIISFYDFN